MTRSLLSSLALALVLGSAPQAQAGAQTGVRAADLPPARLAALKAQEPARLAQGQTHLLAERAKLGLGDPDGFVARNAFTNPRGRTVIHFDQTHQGYRVFGGRAIAHVSEAGVKTLTSSVQPIVSVTGVPALDAQKAVAIALQHLAPKGEVKTAPQVERVVFPARLVGGIASTLDAQGRPSYDRKLVVHAQVATPYTWAYQVTVHLENGVDPLTERSYLIEASTGDLLRVDNLLQFQAAPTVQPAQGLGRTLYRGDVTLDTGRLADGTFALYDPTRGRQNNPYLENLVGWTGSDPSGWTPAGLQTWYQGHSADGAPDWSLWLFQSNPVNLWGNYQDFSAWGQENGVNGQTAGADAHSALTTTWDFYRQVFGRDGFDGQGTATFAIVHYKDNWGSADNASWSRWGKGMYLGAGTFPQNPRGLRNLADFDVVAHELTHGVATSTVDFYPGAGMEEAGLAEATSDIMAQAAKSWAHRAPGAPADFIPSTGLEWKIGMNVGHGTPLRWMDKPSRDGRSVDGWYDGLQYMDGHFSAGVLNRAIYFLANGATAAAGDAHSPYLPGGMAGLGFDAAVRIWYAAFTEYLAPSAWDESLTHLVARDAAIAAAKDLYGGGAECAESIAVENAFAAVNVGNAHGQGPRVLVSFAPWRNGDYVETSHWGGYYRNRQYVPSGETLFPRISVANTPDTRVTWSIGGPSMFNGASWSVEQGGRINADGSWTTPYNLAWKAITATSVADPSQLAEGRPFVINMDANQDNENDALDMGYIAFSWYLSNALNPSHSVYQAPWTDDADVAAFVDAMRAAWPAK